MEGFRIDLKTSLGLAMANQYSLTACHKVYVTRSAKIEHVGS